jgi:hypothetical protein
MGAGGPGRRREGGVRHGGCCDMAGFPTSFTLTVWLRATKGAGMKPAPFFVRDKSRGATVETMPRDNLAAGP